MGRLPTALLVPRIADIKRGVSGMYGEKFEVRSHVACGLIEVMNLGFRARRRDLYFLTGQAVLMS